eukprot:CAMPEP_0198249474 /NCGR_PEP_ID=MMETSP1447-20131203/997_1 /TAXON_ID=420782 /ORGANISM="Chaetoceros dichaeta, Strain CCMP1751" /LENGTH=95 /DNA_ID=CAMNT_0043934121 /DNA_START=64 /DNA_END=351 /DNA_ORIENTATION=+
MKYSLSAFILLIVSCFVSVGADKSSLRGLARADASGRRDIGPLPRARSKEMRAGEDMPSEGRAGEDMLSEGRAGEDMPSEAYGGGPLNIPMPMEP